MSAVNTNMSTVPKQSTFDGIADIARAIEMSTTKSNLCNLSTLGQILNTYPHITSVITMQYIIRGLVTVLKKAHLAGPVYTSGTRTNSTVYVQLAPLPATPLPSNFEITDQFDKVYSAVEFETKLLDAFKQLPWIQIIEHTDEKDQKVDDDDDTDALPYNMVNQITLDVASEMMDPSTMRKLTTGITRGFYKVTQSPLNITIRHIKKHATIDKKLKLSIPGRIFQHVQSVIKLFFRLLDEFQVSYQSFAINNDRDGFKRFISQFVGSYNANLLNAHHHVNEEDFTILYALLEVLHFHHLILKCIDKYAQSFHNTMDLQKLLQINQIFHHMAEVVRYLVDEQLSASFNTITDFAALQDLVPGRPLVIERSDCIILHVNEVTEDDAVEIGPINDLNATVASEDNDGDDDDDMHMDMVD
eukprot:837500_1